MNPMKQRNNESMSQRIKEPRTSINLPMNQWTGESINHETNRWINEALKQMKHASTNKKTEYMNRLINEQRIDKAKIVFQSIKESVQ